MGKARAPRRASTPRKVSAGKARPSPLRRWLLLAVVLLGGFVAWEYLTLPEAAPLLKKNPETTALIAWREAEARAAGRKPRRKQHWVGLSQVSRHGIDAVLLSEDASFYVHEGVDTVQLEKALQEAWEERKLGRGASTITQQLAKNLWLSTDRSLLRKAKELVLTWRLEEALPKKRILTLYLNVAEWGEGVYGIEAGAREHFGISASKLSPAQGALLAAMLPAPRKRSLKSGSKALRRRAHWVVDQMVAVRRVTPAQAKAAHDDIDSLLGVKENEDDDEGS